jgi:hypothetical protein
MYHELCRMYPNMRLLIGFLLAVSATAQYKLSEPIILTGRPGCGGPVAGELPTGLTNCTQGGYTPPNTTLLFKFTTPGDGSYNVLVLLGTLQGDASLMAWLPGQNTSTPPAINGVYTYQTPRSKESYLFIPAAKLAAAGPVHIGIRGSSAPVVYGMQVYSHTRNSTLDPTEAEALGEINRICCSSPISSQTLGVPPQPGSVDFCVTG